MVRSRFILSKLRFLQGGESCGPEHPNIMKKLTNMNMKSAEEMKSVSTGNGTPSAIKIEKSAIEKQPTPAPNNKLPAEPTCPRYIRGLFYY